MTRLVNSLLHAIDNGITEIRIDGRNGSIHNWCIGKNYHVFQWLHEPSVDVILRTRFRTLAFRSPLVDSNELKELEVYEKSLYFYNDKECCGLGAAAVFDCPVASQASMPHWRVSPIIITRNYESEGEVKDEEIGVVNFFDIESFEILREFIDEKQRERINLLTDLWDKRSDHFPHLIFCSEVESQVERITQPAKLVKQIYDKLKVLNTAVAEWARNQNAFNCRDVSERYPINLSPESNCTLRKFGVERMFRLPSGEIVTFSLHLKFGSSLRIHVYADDEKRKFYVGYIGKHLRTCSDN